MTGVWTIEIFVFEFYGHGRGDIEIDTQEDYGAVGRPDEEGFDFEVFNVDCWEIIQCDISKDAGEPPLILLPMSVSASSF